MSNKKSILIIEDNALNRDILNYILEDSYTVFNAENGAEGLSILQAHRDSIELILLDIQMPVMDGFEFMEELRKDGSCTDIPIIVTSSGDDDESQIKCLEMGASEFVSKPYNPIVVRKRAEGLIRLRDTSLTLRRVELDSLTGFYTNESFIEYVRQKLEADDGETYDMVCVEINSYSIFLRRYDIEKRNEAIRDFAKIIEDMVPEGSLKGRISDERFAILLRHSSLEGMKEKMAKFGKEAGQRIDPDLRVNFGIYPKVERDADVSIVVGKALMSINQVRDFYDRNIAEFDDTFMLKKAREQIIEDTAQKGIEEGQFAVYYQPKFNVHSGCIDGAEALVRWIHPQLGFLNPAEFIHIFEKNGFIYEMDKYVLGKVCRDIKEWKEKGRSPVSVSVNISQMDFAHHDLAEEMENIIDGCGVPHELIHFEITESAEVESSFKRNEIIKTLSEKEFVIELDDFGNGYSTINVLGELPVDVIKIDISLTRNMFRPRYDAIIHGVIYAAIGLKCGVVAEGVETNEQVDALKKICTGQLEMSVQGYLLARPMPKEQFEKIIT